MRKLRALASLLLTVVALQLGLAAATTTAKACDRTLPLDGRREPLSQLLQRLSATLGFEVHYWSREDPLVAPRGDMAPVDLIKSLSHKANLIVRYASDRRCPRELRIVTIWVLPGSLDGSPAASADATSGSSAAPRHSPVPSISAHHGTQEYLRVHGVLPATPASPGSAPQ